VSPLFLDTGFLLALESADDQHHAAAHQYWQSFESGNSVPLVTTSYVLDEVATFFNTRGLHAKAVETCSDLMNSPSVLLVHVDEDLFQEAWRYFARHDDKRYSLTDCVSFVVMKRMKIKTALTFDQHFAQAGFERRP
jgi:predicted nucleic acid-binding protein